METIPDNISIRAEGIGKVYQLGVLDRKTFRGELVYAWHRLHGRDPRNYLGKIADWRIHAPQGYYPALVDATFDIRRGETVGLIGKNGAGKSTMLKILARITTPTTGRAFLRGRVGSMLEVGTGFHPELTGRENIYMNGAILGMRKREIDRKFDAIVSFADIGPYLDTPVKRYSSGMYVKLAFAVAANLDTDILLVDEVLAVGDAAFQRKSLACMAEIARSGRTIVFVSHNMETIRRLCSRCLYFEAGRIVRDGPAAETTEAYLRDCAGTDPPAETAKTRQ